MNTHAVRIMALLTGKPKPFREDGTMSAMARRPMTGPVQLGLLGFDGDAVADTVHHGGPDKAVHHYPYDHYGHWQQRLDGHKLLHKPGAFGENIATRGMVESDMRIGDRFQLGAALVEVSQARQPCWKLDHRFGVSGKQSVMAEIVRTGRCGVYFRVVETGLVQTGDIMRLVEAGPHEWTVDRVFRLLIGGQHKAEPEAVRALAALPQLSENWRRRAAALVD
ncbi:MOSC domain-containing protein [Blastomonas sp.]|uniref:MOSC domain-containing protein n=1 Tax=Blastomonas sp. TaxID=1909299 RepID=UPI00359365B9